jgi:hypothetical protein
MSRSSLASRRLRKALRVAGGALLAAALLAAALALPGRGAGGADRLSKHEYELAVRAAYADVHAAFSAARPGEGDLAPRLADAATSLRVAAASLARIRPPTDVAGEHARLVAGLHAYATDVTEVRAAVAAGEEQALASFNARIPTSEPIELMAEAAEAMTFKGYDLGRLSEE